MVSNPVEDHGGTSWEMDAPRRFSRLEARDSRGDVFRPMLVHFVPWTFRITDLPMTLSLTLPVDSMLIESVSATDFEPLFWRIDRTTDFACWLSLILPVESMLIDRTTGFAPLTVPSHNMRDAAHNLKNMALHITCESSSSKWSRTSNQKKSCMIS